MEINKKTENDKTIISIKGEIDSSNVGDFESQLMKAVAGVSNATLDLAGLEYVSSAGLRVFLKVQKMFGSGDALTIINTDEEVMEIFKVTGFFRLLNLK